MPAGSPPAAGSARNEPSEPVRYTVICCARGLTTYRYRLSAENASSLGPGATQCGRRVQLLSEPSCPTAKPEMLPVEAFAL